MKPVVFFTIADENNMPYAKMLEKSFRKFHKDIPFEIISGETLAGYVKGDRMFFYRATPIVAEKYIKEYECVTKIDADSIVCDDISYIWNTKDYDVGTVINWNRIDPQRYGLVQGWGILPVEYMNCGLVAMRSEKFIKHWRTLCFYQQFDRLQYKEQDLLNILVYYGNYNVRCFDHTDPIGGQVGWWGLISKGEWLNAKVENKKIIIPKGQGDTPFPKEDMTVKVIHAGGGNQPNKMNYKTWFKPDVAERITELVS